MAEERFQIRMLVIPEPASGTRTVLVQGGADRMADHRPMFTGDASVDQLCGGCGRVLVDGVPLGQLRSAVLCCGRCGAFNELEVGADDCAPTSVSAP